MTMTLQELSEELRMYAGRPEGIHVDPSAFSVWADAIDAHLSQPQPVAQGEFSVQVTSERMEEVITSMQGPDGEACAGTLWVGRLDDCGPDGSSRYGIHISCNECPEAGSVTLAEFDAPKVVSKGEAVAWRRTDGEGGWFFSEEPSQFDIDLAATYGIIWHPLYATPPIPTGHRVVPVETFDFVEHLQRQRDWSGKTFGPGSRAQGVVDHIRKELLEIEADPGDLKEWIDVVILSLDGAWRSGASPQDIVAALVAKQTKNEGRVWPDWRTADPTKAIEHDRSHEAGGV